LRPLKNAQFVAANPPEADEAIPLLPMRLLRPHLSGAKQ